jgi:cytochrome c peroxidase
MSSADGRARAAGIAARAACALLAIGTSACGGGSLRVEQESTDVADAAREPVLSDAGSREADAESASDAEWPKAEAAAEGDDAAAPVLDADTWALLRKLRYDPSAPARDPSNAFGDDPAARRFGQRLFFATALSGPLLSRDNDGSAPTLGKAGEAGRVSCASCHVPSGGFFDTRSHHRQISLASQWTRRRTPTLLEVAFMPLLNWDGGHDNLWSQAIGVMESAAEFNSSRLFVAEQIARLYRVEYEALFGALPALTDASRFPQLSGLEAGCGEGAAAACRGKPGDGADYDALGALQQEQVTRVSVNAAKAIAAYLGTLRCGAGRFDAWLDGDEGALTPAEQRGAALFVGRADCVRCHAGPRLTDGAFHNVGLRPAPVAVAFTDSGDRGAGEGLPLALASPLRSAGPFSDGPRGTLPTTVTAAHEGAFRTPTLRCAALAPSFMHTGQLRSLEQVVTFFDQGGHPPPGYPGVSELAPLGLSERERSDLAAFLRTLTGPGPAPELLDAPR